MKLTLQQLAERGGVPGRTIRFYIQKGVLAGPEGKKRGAYYTQDHLADLLRIKQWREDGLSLDAIDDLLHARRDKPIEPARPGSVQVRSHLIVAEGLELVVDAGRAGLSQEKLRKLFRAVQKEHQNLKDQ